MSSVVERSLQVFFGFLNYLSFGERRRFSFQETFFGQRYFLSGLFNIMLPERKLYNDKDNDNGDNHCQNDNNDDTGPTCFESKRAHLDISII